MLLTDSFYNYQRKERNCVMTNQKTNSAKIAKMAMLVAISIVLVMVIHLPIFPAVAFLEYDPADIPILVGAFAFGPVAGDTDCGDIAYPRPYGQLCQRPLWHYHAHNRHIGARAGIQHNICKAQDKGPCDNRTGSRDRSHGSSHGLGQHVDNAHVQGSYAGSGNGSHAVHHTV